MTQKSENQNSRSIIFQEYIFYIYIYILFLIATRHDFGFNIEKIPKNDLPKQKKLETSDDKPEEKGDSEPNLK